MLSKIFGSALIGMDSHTVQVEVDVTAGLPAFEIVGCSPTPVSRSPAPVSSRLSATRASNHRDYLGVSESESTRFGWDEI